MATTDVSRRYRFRVLTTFPLGVRQMSRAKHLVDALRVADYMRRTAGPRACVVLIPETRELARLQQQVDATAQEIVADIQHGAQKTLEEICSAGDEESPELAVLEPSVSSAPLCETSATKNLTRRHGGTERKQATRLGRRLDKLKTRAPRWIMAASVAVCHPLIVGWMLYLAGVAAWRKFVRLKKGRERAE